jgi:3-keto-disaccharide hydrolase
MRLLTSILALLLTSAALAQPNTLSDQERADGYALLFDGKTLEGWTTSAKLSAWGIEQDKDGAVLTMLKPGKGWWLRTTKMYRDFDLTLDFDVEKGKNSGVGLRGSSVGDPAFTGMEIQVFGNQGEKPTMTCCGAVYDAIAPVVTTADGTLPLKDGGQWNTYRIKLVGDTLNIWLNGDHIHTDQKLDARGYTHKPEDKNPLNTRCPTGFISLQDHGDKVRFRNIKIKDLSPDKDPGGFEPIFNGKDTQGWAKRVPSGSGTWRVEDGVLIGRDSALQSEISHADFDLRAFVRTSQDAFGGITLRAWKENDAETVRFHGIAVRIDNHDQEWPTGSFSTGVQFNFGKPKPGASSPRDDTWFDLRVCAQGDHVQTWINGQPCAEGTVGYLKPGPVGLSAGRGQIMFKDIQVRDLSKK